MIDETKLIDNKKCEKQTDQRYVSICEIAIEILMRRYIFGRVETKSRWISPDRA